MKLLTEALKKQLPPLYSQEQVEDPMVLCKFFHPLSTMTWYAIEGSPEGEDFIFFGWVHSDSSELGYFSLKEMESINVMGLGIDSLKEMESINVMGLGIERDLHFTPKKLSEVKKEHEPHGNF